MLVLSRGVDDKVVFPHLGITVQILRIAGNKVRLGVDAPPRVRVLREEIAEPADLQQLAQVVAGAVEHAEPPAKLSHDLRNRLNTASLALHLAQKQLEVGMTAKAEATIQRALSEFETLERTLADQVKPIMARVRRRALLVEDNPNESALLAGYLQISGFQVDTVGDGVEAIQYLSENTKPDVVLLDMRMPRLSGPETISSIRCQPQLSGLKLFAVSGSDRSQLNVTVGPAGVDHWFCKPINPQQLVEELDRKLGPAPLSA
jgi:carbon storage regulator CsrA